MKKAEIQERVTQEIIEALETHNSLWSKEWTGGMPASADTKKPYNGINLLILSIKAMVKGYKSNYWITMNQCNKLGGRINKGEKSTLVTYYSPIKFENKEEGTEKTVPLLKSYLVWNIEQTSLKDHEKFKLEENKEIDKTLCSKEIDLLLHEANLDVPINHIRQGRAYYTPSLDTITMPEVTQFSNYHAYYSTVLHELTHSTGHKKRLDRDLKNSFGSNEYAFEELVAEISTMFLLKHYSIDNSSIKDNNLSYIKSWLKKLKSDNSFIFKASSLAGKSFNFITEKYGKEAKKEYVKKEKELVTV